MRSVKELEELLADERQREDAVEGKLLRAANQLTKIRLHRKCLAQQLRKAKDLARTDRLHRRANRQGQNGTVDVSDLQRELGQGDGPESEVEHG